MKLKHILLSLLALAASAPGVMAQSLSEAKQQAVAYLEQCIASVPYGHTALEEGITAVNSAATVQAVAEAKKAATDASIEEMRDDLYRVRITVKNVGLDSYMTVPGKSETPDEQSRPIAFDKKVSHQSVWIFKYLSSGLFRLFNNDRFNVGTLYQSTDKTIVGSAFTDSAFDFMPEFSESGHILLPYFYTWKELDTTTGKTVEKTEKRYLLPNADGQLEYALEPIGANAEWILARAYESKDMDGPYLTFDIEHPILYTIENINGQGYLTVHDVFAYADVTPGVKEYSFWYFVDRGRGNGDVYIVNVCNHQLTYSEPGYRVYTRTDLTENLNALNDKPWRPFVMPGFESEGLAFTLEITQPHTHSADNLHCLGWTAAGYNGCKAGQSGKPSLTDPKNYVWKVTPISANTEQLTEAKRVAREKLSVWMPRSDFGQSVLQGGMDEIDAVDVFSYPSVDLLQPHLDQIVNATLTHYIQAVNAELPGSQMTLRSVNRLNAKIDALLAMTPTTVNTVATPTHDAVWCVEDGGDGYLRFHTIDGLYLGQAKSMTNLTTTTDPAQAGLYSLELTDNGGFAVVSKTASTIGLNADTKGSAAVGFKKTDVGSAWTLWRTAAINQLEDGIKYTTDPNVKRYYYLIRNKANQNAVIRGFGDKYNCSWGDMNVNAYWYVTKGDNGDSSYLVVNESGCFMNYNYVAYTTAGSGRKFYLIPRGTTAAEGYYISITWPATGACYLRPALVNGQYQQMEGTALTEANKDQLTWLFEEQENIDYQGIFEKTSLPQADMLEAYKEVQPWGHDLIDEAVSHLRGPWTDFGSTMDNACNAIAPYVSNTLTAVEEIIETEARHQAVNITNVRCRDNSFSSGAHLAIVDGTVTTVADPLKAAWLMEYVNNGRYRLHMANTEEHLGPLPEAASQKIEVTTDYREAGLYSFVLKNGAVSIINRSKPEWGVNIDMNGSPAVSYNSSDAGSKWAIAIADPAAIEEIEADSSLLIPNSSFLIDLQGRKVTGTPAPGVYMTSTGEKIIVK